MQLQLSVLVLLATSCLACEWSGSSLYGEQESTLRSLVPNQILQRYVDIHDHNDNGFWLRFDRGIIVSSIQQQGNSLVYDATNPDGLGDHHAVVEDYSFDNNCAKFSVRLHIDNGDVATFKVASSLEQTGNYRFKLKGSIYDCQKDDAASTGSLTAAQICDAQIDHAQFAQKLQRCLLRGFPGAACAVYANL